MNTSGDAAEQVVRMVLEGTEYLVKLSGKGAISAGTLIYSVVRQQKKTKGAERLTNMLRNGKALKVYTFDAKDLGKFKEVAGQYGVLYTVLKEKDRSDGVFDVLVRAEDDSKLNRIIDRFNLVRVDQATIRAELVKEQEARKAAESEGATSQSEPEKEQPEKSYEERVLDELEKKPMAPEVSEPSNPKAARTETSPEKNDSVSPKMEENLSEPSSEAVPSSPVTQEKGETDFRPSVKEKIRQIDERKKAEKAEGKVKERVVPDIPKAKVEKSKER